MLGVRVQRGKSVRRNITVSEVPKRKVRYSVGRDAEYAKTARAVWLWFCLASQ